MTRASWKCAGLATKSPGRDLRSGQVGANALEKPDLLVILSQQVVSISGIGHRQDNYDGGEAVIGHEIPVCLDGRRWSVGVQGRPDRGLHEGHIPRGDLELVSEVPICLFVITRNPSLKSEDDRRLMAVEIGDIEIFGFEHLLRRPDR